MKRLFGFQVEREARESTCVGVERREGTQVKFIYICTVTIKSVLDLLWAGSLARGSRRALRHCNTLSHSATHCNTCRATRLDFIGQCIYMCVHICIDLCVHTCIDLHIYMCVHDVCILMSLWIYIYV